MESSNSGPSAFVLPHYQPDPGQPGQDGFEGLDLKQRAVRAEILCRAHSIWESKGRPDNSELADWLEAEAQVMSEA